jgi:dTDP-4-dehydrorhamnose reductase
MRIYLTGASGFVGSNLAHVFGERHGAEVIAPGHEHVDLTDEVIVRRSVAATRPDAIVHCAIWNDPIGLARDHNRAWREYVGATRHLVDAANVAEIQIVLISTDWVFDGTRAPATELTAPHPINTYGALKAASEVVVAERAVAGTIARIGAVQGVHRARPSTPRQQDAGFGYLVASLVQALRGGESFMVWDGPELNALATPTLATDAGELIWRALELGATGILHCCGAEHVDRVALARRAVEAFDLDPELLSIGRAPAEVFGDEPVPRDTRLDATVTAQRLGVELSDLDTMLARLRAQLEGACSPV